MTATERLAAMRARCEVATPGPWVAVSRSSDEQDDDYFLGWEIDGPRDAYRGQFARRADAEFIAHARADVPALLAVVEAAVARQTAEDNINRALGERRYHKLAALEARARASRSALRAAIDAFATATDAPRIGNTHTGEL